MNMCFPGALQGFNGTLAGMCWPSSAPAQRAEHACHDGPPSNPFLPPQPPAAFTFCAHVAVGEEGVAALESKDGQHAVTVKRLGDLCSKHATTCLASQFVVGKLGLDKGAEDGCSREFKDIAEEAEQQCRQVFQVAAATMDQRQQLTAGCTGSACQPARPRRTFLPPTSNRPGPLRSRVPSSSAGMVPSTMLSSTQYDRSW